MVRLRKLSSIIVIALHLITTKKYLDLDCTERITPELDRPRISSARMVPDAIKARLEIKDCVDQLDDTRVA